MESRSTTGVGGMTSSLLHSLLHTNCCTQVQEGEEIQNDIDFSSIKRARAQVESRAARERQQFQRLVSLPAAPSKQMDQRAGSTRHHVADTFKSKGDHFQGLTEPLSRPKFHPLHSPANGHWCVRKRDREMDMAAIAITTCIGLYLALRLTLRVYFPPDT